MQAKRRIRPGTKNSSAFSPERLAEELAALRHELEGLQRLLHGRFERSDEPPLYTVVENGNALPAVNELELDPWRRAPANVLLDLTCYRLWLSPPDSSERREVRLDGHGQRDTRLGGPVLDFLQVLAEHPGQRITPTVTGELTGKVIDPASARQFTRRIRARLQLGSSEMIRTEKNVSSSLPGRGPVYYADPAWTWRVVRYAEWLSRKNASRRPPGTAA